MKILLLDFAVGIPAFFLATYGGANIAIALSCGFLAASTVNIIGASINLNRIGRMRNRS